MRLKDSEGLNHFQISHEYVNDFMDWSGAMVLLPNRSLILPMIQQSINILDPDYVPPPTPTPIPLPTPVSFPTPVQ